MHVRPLYLLYIQSAVFSLLYIAVCAWLVNASMDVLSIHSCRLLSHAFLLADVTLGLERTCCWLVLNWDYAAWFFQRITAALMHRNAEHCFQRLVSSVVKLVAMCP